jgi:hypothetical protein
MQGITFYHALQGLAHTEKMGLAKEFGQLPRSHPVGQRSCVNPRE